MRYRVIMKAGRYGCIKPYLKDIFSQTKPVVTAKRIFHKPELIGIKHPVRISEYILVTPVKVETSYLHPQRLFFKNITSERVSFRLTSSFHAFFHVINSVIEIKNHVLFVFCNSKKS